MPKEESGRLFSKVAKFVRNPLKDWSELDAPSSASSASDSSLPAQTYSREMLKEMIERRQRNDFVRRREFDMLRKLRQREAAAHAFEATVTPSSFNVNSSSERSEGLEKSDAMLWSWSFQVVTAVQKSLAQAAVGSASLASSPPHPAAMPAIARTTTTTTQLERMAGT